jgi:hypothetical protein
MATRRNYQPGLRRILHLLSRFGARYQSLLLAGFTAPQATAFGALMAAVDQMIAEIPPGTGE